MDAPRFDLLFKPIPYEHNPNEVNNFIGNIAALQDPSGTLARKQAEQIAATAAKVKADDLRGEFKDIALKAIQDNLDNEMQMYKGNKGFNRLSLNGQQLLQKQKADQSLIMDVAALRNLGDDYEKALAQAHTDVYKNVISQDDYNAFDQAFKEKLAGAKSAKDIPSALAMYNTFLANKPYDWAAMSKEVTQAVKDAESVKDVEQEGDVFYNTEKKNPEYIAKAMMSANPKFYKFWMDVNGGDVPSAIKAATEYVSKYSKDNRTYAGQVRKADNININNGGNRGDGKYIIPFVPSNVPILSSFKTKKDAVTGKAYDVPFTASQQMHLNTQENFVPWTGNLKDESGKDVAVNGGVTDVLLDQNGIMWARVVAKKIKSGGSTFDLTSYDPNSASQDVITQDIPFTHDIRERLIKAEVDVNQINQMFGKGNKSSAPQKNTQTQTQPEKTYRMQDALIEYQGYSAQQIREAMSKLGYKEIK